MDLFLFSSPIKLTPRGQLVEWKKQEMFLFSRKLYTSVLSTVVAVFLF